MIHVIAVITAKPGKRMAALEAHARAPHMAAYGAKTKDLLASRTIHVLAPC